MPTTLKPASPVTLMPVPACGTPLGMNLIVARDLLERFTAEGIEIPTGSLDQKKRGICLAVGREAHEKFPEIKVGSRLLWLYNLPSDAEIPSDGDEDWIILDAHDIAMILKD